MFVVIIENEGGAYWLRGTIWTGGRDRAAEFATEELARAALEKARKFTKPAQFRKARVVQA